MREFAPGEAKTAVAPITMSPAGLSCQAEIFLGPNDTTKVATSGKVAFTSTGVSQNIRLPIAMPAEGGPYHVYIDVYTEGLLVLAYQVIEDVVIKVAEQADHFISAVVPAQVARGVFPDGGGGGNFETERFLASHKVFLKARSGYLYIFLLSLSVEGVSLDVTDYISQEAMDRVLEESGEEFDEDDNEVANHWRGIQTAGFLPSEVQRAERSPVDQDDIYVGSGTASLWWYPYGSHTNVKRPPPLGIYKVYSTAFIIQGNLTQTFGQPTLLWEVDTGKTIEVV
ncbi:hypothetical protein LCGC14_0263530 [marine sediment metagenome]|uniref:Uncharacterized protein n=1 Tax=marine sediment metagenome TaxID=412755 RepID=A0A0F9X672_9ZZZZ